MLHLSTALDGKGAHSVQWCKYHCTNPAGEIMPAPSDDMELLLMKIFQHGSIAHKHVTGKATATGGWWFHYMIENVLLKPCSPDSLPRVGLSYLQGFCVSYRTKCSVMWQMSSWMLVSINTVSLTVISCCCTIQEVHIGQFSPTETMHYYYYSQSQIHNK
jgi:hypothetical protein